VELVLATQIVIIGFVSWLQPAMAAAALAVIALAAMSPRTTTGTSATARAFGSYYVGIARHPVAGFAALEMEPCRLRLGTYALLSNATLYTLVWPSPRRGTLGA
jgi:hypothetical protein